MEPIEPTLHLELHILQYDLYAAFCYFSEYIFLEQSFDVRVSLIYGSLLLFKWNMICCLKLDLNKKLALSKKNWDQLNISSEGPFWLK